MIYLHKILPALLSPYSLFLLCIIVGLVKKKYVIIWTALIVVLILSTPVVSSFLFAQLEAVGSRKTPADIHAADAIVVDCTGKYIYPSFIDLYADYGMPAQAQAQGGFGRGFFGAAQLSSGTKGAFGWNQAIKADVNAASLFVTDDAKAKAMREIGFGAVLTHQKDGIARGTGAFVSLASMKENMVILKEKASAHYSFSTVF